MAEPLRLVKVALNQYVLAPRNEGGVIRPIIYINYNPETQEVSKIEVQLGYVAICHGPWHDEAGEPVPAVVIHDEDGNEILRAPLA